MTIPNTYPQLRNLCDLLDQVHKAADDTYLELMRDQHLAERAVVLLERLTGETPHLERSRKNLLAELRARVEVGDILTESDEGFQRLKNSLK